MPIFMVMTSIDPKNVEIAINKRIPSEDVLQIDNRSWLISSPKNIVTPKELYDLLSSDGELNRTIITLMTAYWGLHNSEIWDWLSVKKG
ncbi:TPA: hypothetical protein U2M34_003257 [Providencia rettgeri]|nr:hypothetical protein [Providencia rettgeri]